MTVHPLPSHKLTYEDYVAFPDDGLRREILDGELFVSASPNLRHQTVSRRLLVQLFLQIEKPGLGQVFDAPTDVQLGDHDLVVPDLFVVRREREYVLTPIKVRGTPDLVIEILSPAAPQVDQGRKKERYEAHAVAEYWIVDPDENVVEQWRYTSNGYECAAVCREQVEPREFPGVVVNLRNVWGP
jgi:Uma2 family endonuclease